MKSKLAIRVGDFNNKEDDTDEEEFDVEEIFMHEGYSSEYRPSSFTLRIRLAGSSTAYSLPKG